VLWRLLRFELAGQHANQPFGGGALAQREDSA
jgi:hypothetical protein